MLYQKEHTMHLVVAVDIDENNKDNAFIHMFSPNIEFRKCNDYILMMKEKLVDDIRKIIKGMDLFTVWLIWRNEQSETNQFVEAIEKYKQVMSKGNVFINNLYKRSMVGWEENFNEKVQKKKSYPCCLQKYVNNEAFILISFKTISVI